jgi:hypothetical protein
MAGFSLHPLPDPLPSPAGRYATVRPKTPKTSNGKTLAPLPLNLVRSWPLSEEQRDHNRLTACIKQG